MADKVWVIENPDELLRSTKKRSREEAPLTDEKDPARSYTLSLLFWGAGQIDNDQLRKGLAFLGAMIAGITAVILGVVYRTEFVHAVRSSGISLSFAVLAAEALLFCVLLFWTYNAGDAYHGAVKSRRSRFSGVKSRFWPPFCSLVVPGWGQFLNGQPVKGSIFTGLSIMSFFSLVSIPLVLLAWPSLEPTADRLLVEAIFAISVLFVPVTPFIWILGCFDAWSVSADEIKKEPLWERIKAANNRRRTQGWVRGVFPWVRSAFVLALVLAFLALIVHFSIPENFYRGLLVDTRAHLQSKGMMIVPDLIGRMISGWERLTN